MDIIPDMNHDGKTDEEDYALWEALMDDDEEEADPSGNSGCATSVLPVLFAGAFWLLSKLLG